MCNGKVYSFDCIATFQAMMTVKRYGHGNGASSIGKPAVHPATVDLKGKSYEYVNLDFSKSLFDINLVENNKKIGGVVGWVGCFFKKEILCGGLGGS